ncbi:hypothetical protein F4810DRAFT_455023 [Camillea tinctor]|nr:hypothetical protein F4810DRAFT_455023 [Camillea tinctor]
MAHSPSDDEIPLDLRQELVKAIDSLCDETVEASPSVHNAIEKWLSYGASRPAKAKFFLYHLADSSQEMVFAMEALSPSDLARYWCLERLGCQHNFNVFLSQAEKRVGGTIFDFAGDEMEEGYESDVELPIGTMNEDESEWSVQLLLDTSNGQKTPKLALDNPNMLQGDVFEGCEPDEEGDPADYYDEPQHPNLRAFVHYHRSLALVIVPLSTTASFLSNFKLNDETISGANSLVTHFASKCKAPGSRNRSLEILTKLCSELFPQQNSQAWNAAKFPEETIAQVLEVAVRTQDPSLFDTVCKNIEVDLSPQFFTWISEKTRESSLPFTTLQPALERTILAAPRLGDRYTKILSLNTLSATTPPALREAVLAVLDKVVDRCLGTDPLFEQDGETLVFMASAYRDYNWLLKKIGPVIYQRRKDYAFVIGFSWQLYTNIRQNKLQIHDSFEYLKSCMTTLLKDFDVSLLLSINGFVRQQGKRRTQPKTPVPQPPVTKETLTNLCTLLLELSMESDFRELVTKLIDQSQRIDPPEFIDLYLPFTRDLMTVLEKHARLFQEPIVSSFFRTFVLECWNKYVGEAPKSSGHDQAMSSWQARVMETRGELGRFDQEKLSDILGADYHTLLGVPSTPMCPSPQWQNTHVYPPVQTNMLPTVTPAPVASYGQPVPAVPAVPQTWQATHPTFFGGMATETSCATRAWNLPANSGRPPSWQLQTQAGSLIPTQQPYLSSQPMASPATQRTLGSSPRIPLTSIPQNLSPVIGQNDNPPAPPFTGQKRKQVDGPTMDCYQATKRFSSTS